MGKENDSKLKTQLIRADGSTDGADKKQPIDGFAGRGPKEGGRPNGGPSDFDRP